MGVLLEPLPPQRAPAPQNAQVDDRPELEEAASLRRDVAVLPAGLRQLRGPSGGG